MMPDRWQQIMDLYHAAAARDRAERVPFLDEACGHDADLRRRVESLVEAHAEAGGFIETPTFEVAPEFRVAAMAGRLVGHYRIESMLGAGGIAEVYLAEDTKLRRKVAVKFLPEAMASDRDRLERFQREAHAVAALNHPNIVTIHSGRRPTASASSPWRW